MASKPDLLQGEINNITICTCMYHQLIFSVGVGEYPTYGGLIDLYLIVEREDFNDETVLCAKFKELYPHICIGRPRRFFETVQRIVAPVRPSSLGTVSITDSASVTYRKRKWLPHSRNTPKGKLQAYF